MSSSPPNDSPGVTSLLAVFAHPDDESLACGGLLALAAERGVRVSILCATPGGARGAANARIQELNAAARVLGIADVTVLEYEDGMLSWIDAGSLEHDIAEAIRRIGADVVVTFGEDGLYWHPDHVAIHERATAAVARLRAAAPALYYVTMPPGQMRRVMDTAAARAAAIGHAAPRLILGIDNPDAFGADALPPTVVLDIRGAATRKLAAIRCHASQLRHDAFESMSDSDAARLLDVEHYRRADLGAPGETFIDALARQGHKDE